MKFWTKIFAWLMLFGTIALSGWAWGPCGRVFTGGDPRQEQRKSELRKNADAVKDAAAKPPTPTQ